MRSLDTTSTLKSIVPFDSHIVDLTEEGEQSRFVYIAPLDE